MEAKKGERVARFFEQLGGDWCIESGRSVYEEKEEAIETESKWSSKTTLWLRNLLPLRFAWAVSLFASEPKPTHWAQDEEEKVKAHNHIQFNGRLGIKTEQKLEQKERKMDRNECRKSDDFI